jgi:hypothetical protein
MGQSKHDSFADYVARAAGTARALENTYALLPNICRFGVDDMRQAG